MLPYTLRNEQATAVTATAEYFKSGMGKEYLWNAKPRFGKTLSVYELCKKLEAELLNFFPVIGEDENGEMVELDAEKVLSIPRKIRSQEVVRRGFMSDFLFQNISHVFHAPQEVIDIITSFTPVQEPGKKADITPDTSEKLSLDDNGKVSLEEGYVIGKSAELFGEKIYESIPYKLNDAISDINMVRDSAEYSAEKLKQTLHTEAVKIICFGYEKFYPQSDRT